MYVHYVCYITKYSGSVELPEPIYRSISIGELTRHYVGTYVKGTSLADLVRKAPASTESLILAPASPQLRGVGGELGLTVVGYL